MADRIEKTMTVGVPVARLWHVMSEPQEVSAWFGARFVEAFVPGQKARGIVTYPGYEGLTFEINIIAKKEPTLFSFSWHPYAIDTTRDYSRETPTLVEFHLAPISGGTRLTVIESGFEALPADRAAQAYAGNNDGWGEILDKIAKHAAL